MKERDTGEDCLRIAFWGDDIGNKGWKWARGRAFHAEGQQGSRRQSGKAQSRKQPSDSVSWSLIHTESSKWYKTFIYFSCLFTF